VILGQRSEKDQIRDGTGPARNSVLDTVLYRLYKLSPHLSVITRIFNSMARFRMLFANFYHCVGRSDSLGIINLPGEKVGLVNSFCSLILCRNPLDRCFEPRSLAGRISFRQAPSSGPRSPPSFIANPAVAPNSDRNPNRTRTRGVRAHQFSNFPVHGKKSNVACPLFRQACCTVTDWIVLHFSLLVPHGLFLCRLVFFLLATQADSAGDACMCQLQP
jgi:hypothetical protein